MARKNLGMEAIRNRVRKMVEMRDEYIKHLEDVHVRLMQGNTKTGKSCWTVSLIPIADCINCSGCMKTCYDICNVCYIPDVQKTRAMNSAIHKADKERFWKEIEMGCMFNGVQELRINVGGDLDDDDFEYINEMGKKLHRTDILFFTKNYQGINKWMDIHGDFNSNVKPIMSAWIGMEMDNHHNLPCS